MSPSVPLSLTRLKHRIVIWHDCMLSYQLLSGLGSLLQAARFATSLAPKIMGGTFQFVNRAETSSALNIQNNTFLKKVQASPSGSLLLSGVQISWPVDVDFPASAYNEAMLTAGKSWSQLERARDDLNRGALQA